MSNKIIIVDDDIGIRKLLSTLLELEGYEIVKDVQLSMDGILNTIRSQKPGIVLMDVHIKEIDGVEILRRIRSEPELSTIRIIMSSGHDFKTKCLDAGANGFLMKPYMPAELMAIIK